MPNTLLLAICIKWPNVLSSIISANALDLLLSFSLNRGLELLEYTYYLIFGPQNEGSNFPRKVINKSHKVLCTTKRSYRHFANIGMYQVQLLGLLVRR